MAAQNGHLNIVEILLKQGADPNVINTEVMNIVRNLCTSWNCSKYFFNQCKLKLYIISIINFVTPSSLKFLNAHNS